MTATPMRGLSVFVREVLACASKEAEEARVEKELLNIRSKFAAAQCKSNSKSKRLALMKTKSKGLKSYDKIKYVWKLVYISMLGYDIDFGHMEVINLLSSTDLSEKQVGYLAAGMLISSDSELITLIVNSVRSDLKSKNHVFQSLALSAIANISGEQLAESLSGEVMALLTADNSTQSVKQKAALCILSLYRIDNDVLQHDEFVQDAKKVLAPSASRSLGIVLSLMGLILELVPQNNQVYSPLVAPVVELLEQVVVHKKISSSYVYHGVPAPWTQIKLLEFLQHYPLPKEDRLRRVVLKILTKCIDSHDKDRCTSDANARNAVIFAAIDLVVSYGDAVTDKLQEKAIGILAELISDDRRNVRYLGMSFLCRLKSIDKVRPHYPQVLKSLGDWDASIRRRSLDLLSALCHPSNSEDIINGLIEHLTGNALVEMKEELILRIAILAERYLLRKQPKAYVDTVLRLLYQSGDFVPNELLYRFIQVITNTEAVQLYACSQLYCAIETTPPHHIVLAAAAYILGEFGYLLVESEPNAGFQPCSTGQLFATLDSHFGSCSNENKAKLLHAYAKLAHLFDEELGKKIKNVFEELRTSTDFELQQRAIEYLAMPQFLTKEKMEYVMDAMPLYNENRVSAVVRKLQGTKGSACIGVANNESPEVLSEDAAASEISEKEPVKPKGISPNLMPQMMEWFTNCIKSSKAVVFEDDIVQVGMQKQFKGSEGKVIVFVRNKTKASIERCDIELEAQRGLKVEPKDISLGALMPGEQGKQMLDLNCVAPYLQPPNMMLRFAYNGVPHEYALRLPAVFANFMTKATVNVDQFNKQWENMKGNEQRQVLRLNHAVSGETVMSMLDIMNFQAVSEPDPSSCVRAAAGIRLGKVNPQDKAVTLGCLVQINPGDEYVLAVRSPDPEASLAIKVVLQQQLSNIS